MEPLIKSTTMFNSPFLSVMKSVAMMNSALYPLGHSVGAIMQSKAFAGVGAVMRSSSVLQVGEAVRGMTAVGSAFNKVVGDAVGNDFLAVTETLRKVDWRAAIEDALEEGENDQAEELKSEAGAAGDFLNAEMQGILDEVKQTPQGMLAALTAFHQRVAESSLGKKAKCLALWIITNIIWSYVIVPLGGYAYSQLTHRETLKTTKHHVLETIGHHPQLRIVSVESRLNMRMKPNRKSHVVGKLYPYTVVTVIGHAGKWAKVCFASGQGESVEGWVFNKYLSKLK